MFLAATTTPTGLKWQDSLIVAVYCVALVFLGLYFKWRERRGDAEEYLLASRSVHWLIVGIASFMTLISVSSLVSLPGEAYNHGVSLAVRSVIGPLLGIPMFYLCIRFYFAAGIYTPFTYLERRFDRRIRVVGSISYLIIRTFYLALTLFASAKVFEGVAGWSFMQSVLLVSVVGLAYVYLGGMKAVVWADFFQFIILILGLVLIVVACMNRTGLGLGGLWQYAQEQGRGFNFAAQADFYSLSPYVRVSLFLIIFSAFSDRLFYLSADQMAVQRLLSAHSYSSAARANLFSMLLQIPVILFVWFVGLAVFAYYGQTHPAESRPPGDVALFQFVATQLPPFGGGLFIAACLGAIMSTYDAGLHSLATVYVKDVHLIHVNPAADETRQVWLSRAAILAVAAATIAGAFIIGYTAPAIAGSFIETQVFWIAFQGIVAVCFLAGVLSTRATGRDIRRAFWLSGLVTVGTVIWYVHSRRTGQPISFLFVALPGELAMFVFSLLPSLWRSRLPEERIRNLTLFTLDSREPRDARPHTKDGS